MQKKFQTVAVGGTFDEFHKGHRTLLMKAFEVGERVLIGVSSDKFAEKMAKPHPTASYKQRSKDLKDFLHQHQLVERAEIIQLNEKICDLRPFTEIENDNEAEELKKKLQMHFRKRYRER